VAEHTEDSFTALGCPWYLRTFFDECPFSVFIFDTQGKVIDVNAWYVGQSEEGADHHGESIFDLVISSDPETIQALGDLLAGVPFQGRRFHLQSPAGTAAFGKACGIPLRDGKGGVHGAILLHQPCESRESQRSSRVEEDVEEFLYAVSHDLKSPIASICGFAEVLLEEFGERLENEGKHWLTRIHENAKKLNHMVSDLLSFYRTGEDGGGREVCDMGLVVGEAVEGLEFEVQDTRSRVILPASMPSVLCHPTQIYRLWSNILSNSLRYRHPHRRLEIEVGRREESDRFVFWVRDNGTGIPDAKKEQVFNLFERLGKKPERGGTGIGLAIARRIALNHGGDIWLESKEGVGTTVYFTLPRPTTSSLTPAADTTPSFSTV
jgi:signal transduction histidine kinase